MKKRSSKVYFEAIVSQIINWVNESHVTRKKTSIWLEKVCGVWILKTGF
jgi:hypothetical protein